MKTGRRKRLMASGYEAGAGIRTGKLLVKKEWEMAELWLRENIDKKKK